MYNCFYIVYDLETGGLISKDGDIPPITEFACCILNNNLEVVEEMDFFIKPYRDNSHYTPKALEVSNITLEMCEERGLTHSEASSKIINAFKKAKPATQGKKPVLVGHNIDNFDNRILDYFLQEDKQDLSKYVESNFTIDTMWWGRMNFPEMSGFTLSDCLMHESIDNEQAHRAIGDVRANKELFVKMMSRLRGISQVAVAPVENTFRKSFRFQLAKRP